MSTEIDEIEKRTEASNLQQVTSDEVETDDEASEYGSTYESFQSEDDDNPCLETEGNEKKMTTTSNSQERSSDKQPAIKKDEVSSDETEMDGDSTIGSLRSSTSLSVSEYRYGPCLEIEEYDEGFVVFSRTSSSRSSVSSFSSSQRQAHSQSFTPSLFRRLSVIPRISRRPADTFTTPEWLTTLNIVSSHRATEFKVFTKTELKRATNNYSTDWIIGEGRFSVVYRGILDDQTVVAVKKCKATADELITKMFANGISVLSRINHPHVVKLLGWCSEAKVPIMVLEYIPNGTLFSLISEKRDKLVVFPLNTRLRIAAEIAEVLAYLHRKTSPPICHGDLSSKNILLGANYTVKVFDFMETESNSLAMKFDVFGFGMVLLHLLTGKKVYGKKVSGNYISMESFFARMREDRLLDILDTEITGRGLTAELRKVLKLTAECLRDPNGKILTMKDVYRELEALIRSRKRSLVLDNNTNDSKEMMIIDNGMSELQAEPIKSIGIDTRSVIDMKIKRKANKVNDTTGTISIGPWRYQHEYWFDDEPFDHCGYDGIKMIIIYCCSYPADRRINSIRVQYTKQGELEWTDKVGEEEGDRFEIVLDHDEYIMRVTGFTCLISERPGLCSLTFISNRRSYWCFGHNQKKLEWEMGRDYIFFEYSDGKLVGFKGTSGRYISSIGFYVQSLPRSRENFGGKGKGISSTTSAAKQVPWEIQRIYAGPFGNGNCSFSNVFDHKGYDGIKSIFIGHNDHHIHYFKVEYVKNGQPQITDGIGDVDKHNSVSKVVLDYPDEFLEAVTGSYFVTFYDRSVGISSLTCYSNMRKYGPFGFECGQPFEVSGGKIVGFRGDVDGFLYHGLLSIGFYILPY